VNKLKLGRELLYLTEEDVKKCITMEEAVKLSEKGVIMDGQGRCAGNKFYMDLGDKGFLKPFAGYLEGEEYAFEKNFTIFNGNYQYNYPATISTAELFEKNYGIPVCFMEASWVTGLKTGASTAVTVKYLKKSDASIVTLFGAGVQARSHLEALTKVMDISEVRVVDKFSEKAESFAKEFSEKYDFNIFPMTSNKEAVEGSDVILTLTTTSDILVEYNWLKPGAFVGKLGTYQEINPEIILKADKFVVDRWKYVSVRVPEIIKLREEGKLKEEDAIAWPKIAGGKVKGRENDDEIIVYACLGIWGEYAAILPQVYRNAIANGVGTKLPLHQTLEGRA